jgi:hypothetical protein
MAPEMPSARGQSISTFTSSTAQRPRKNSHAHAKRDSTIAIAIRNLKKLKPAARHLKLAEALRRGTL